MSREAIAYHGGPVDDAGVPPDPWDMEVPPPQDFEDRTERVVIPHTERVETCGTCSGFGHVTCGRCFGSGQTTCSLCGGSGFQTRTETITETDANGNTSTRTETHQESCSCFNGRVTCSGCGGSGRVVCGACEGSGKIKTFDLLTVNFQEKRSEAVIDTTDVPDNLVKEARGERVVNLQQERIGSCPPVFPTVNAQADTLLKQSQSQPEDTRLLFQRLFIERIGVHEVQYRYRQSEMKRLWVYGEPMQVYAPNAPKAWGRITATLASVITIIGVVLFFVILQPTSHPEAETTAPINTASPSATTREPTSAETGTPSVIPVLPKTPAEEIENLREQIQRSPTDSVLHDSLAQAYLRANQPDKAIYHLKQVIKLIPNTDRARTAAQTLKKITPK